ncbi:hypothetical protein EK21DRAFT_24969, partial [Setomelanomma holmii]
HGHAQGHALEHRAFETHIEVVTVTQVITVTVDLEISTSTTAESSTFTIGIAPSSEVPSVSTSSALTQGPHTNTSQPTSPIAAPSATVPNNNSSNPFRALDTIPDIVTVLNSCDYPVYIWSVGHTSCDGEAADCKLISPNDIYKEPMRKCETGGISLKVSRSTNSVAPMQLEYTVDPVNHATVYYDLSYLDCMKNGSGEQDLSGCAGHDGGIQAVGGGDCRSFKCKANEWCAVQAYVVPEFGYRPDPPVGGCRTVQGVAFELCAGNR